jgi:hypothetical protein
MNPREFCREPGYDKALLFTYEFNALFFERIVLRDLLTGGANDIQVVADLGRVSEVQQRWKGQVRSLGKRYRLSCATLRGAFHPKILLRTGPQGAILWIGSGNITYGGWGGNAEVGTGWRIGSGTNQGPWLKGILRDLGEWVPANLEDTTFQRILADPWLVGENEQQERPPVIVSRRDASIGTQLLERWAGRHFDSLTLATGSTDEKGALLSWFGQHFGISEATVLLDPVMASFDPSKLELLPMQVKLLALNDLQRVHAKFFWLSGSQGSAAVIGSANCSAAAWLLTPQEGGNIESVAVYDDPLELDFVSILSRFGPEQTTPIVLPARSKDKDEDGDVLIAPYPVAEVNWDRVRGELVVTFAHPLPIEAEVAASFSNFHTSCQPRNGRAVWIATVETSNVRRVGTLFATISIGIDGVDIPDQQFWVNELAELRASRDGHGFWDPIKSLSKPSTSSDQQKIVAALQNIGNLILTDQIRFPDPIHRAAPNTTRTSSRETETTHAPIDPAELIRSLDETITKANGSHGSFALHGVTLTGVMSTLFQLPDDHENFPSAEFDNPEGPPSPPAPQPPSGPPPNPPPPPKHSAAKKLEAHMEIFLGRLAEDKFALECTVEQLIQASAYPLAVIAFGSAGGWINEEVAQKWTTRVFDILFYKPYADKVSGLLASVERRNQQEARADVFRQTIGSGVLWAAMLAGIWRTNWTDKNGPLRKALTMRAVLTAQVLLSSADVGRVACLLQNLAPHFDPQSLIDNGRATTRVLASIETYIQVHWTDLLTRQLSIGPRIRENDVHYHPHGGWAFAAEQSKELDEAKLYVYRQNRAGKIIVQRGFYLNISQAAERGSFLSAQLRELAGTSEAMTTVGLAPQA